MNTQTTPQHAQSNKVVTPKMKADSRLKRQSIGKARRNKLAQVEAQFDSYEEIDDDEWEQDYS